MSDCTFIVNKHELYVFKQYFEVNIKLINNLIRSMQVKNRGKYALMIKQNKALRELMLDFRIITEDHIMLGEDMILNLDYSLLEDLIRYAELVLAFCKHDEYKNSAGLENLRRVCNEGIENVEVLETVYKRMKLMLHMNNNYTA